MTDDDLNREVHDLANKVEKLEAERERLKELPEAVSRLEGAVGTLTTIVDQRFDNVDRGVSKAQSLETMLKVAASVIVPIIVALISGYFLLKGQLATHPVPR